MHAFSIPIAKIFQPYDLHQRELVTCLAGSATTYCPQSVDPVEPNTNPCCLL